MAILIEHPSASFLSLVTIFLAFFTFIAGIGLAATNQLAIGLGLVLSNILTIATVILLYIFKGVIFVRTEQQEESPQQAVVNMQEV